MRNIDQATLDALNGSRSGDTLTVYAWYGGQLSYEDPLPVKSWALDWDLTRKTQTLNLTVDDQDGKLAPWLLEDPLGVGGAQLQCMYSVGGGGVPVNMGWYRITASDPTEQWVPYVVTEKGIVHKDSPLPKDKRLILVSGGAEVQVTGDDLGIMIQNARFLAPESPQGASPTVVGELTRILQDIVPVVTAPGVVDQPVSTKLIYKDDRLAICQDLCNRIGCDYRMNGDGMFEVYPIAAQAPVWTLAGGPEGVLVNVNRSQKIDGLYNIFVVTGTKQVTKTNGTTVQVPIVSIAYITAGPLAYDGEHGAVPTFYDSTMITTQAEADAYAQTMMSTQLAGLTVDLKCECLPHPGLQQGDWVTVAAPVVNGQQVTLNGRVKTMGLKSNGTSVDRMTLTVQCSYQDVQTAIGGVDRG